MAQALISLLLLLLPEAAGSRVEWGRLSVYRPGDGWNRGELACGGRYTSKQIHVAHRDWRLLGCGRRVQVCAEETGRCVLTRVMDAGPWGIYRGPLRRAVTEGRWKVWTKRKAPAGWKFRASVDLSWALWKRLGRPRGLSRVRMVFLPRRVDSTSLISRIEDEVEGR